MNIGIRPVQVAQGPLKLKPLSRQDEALMASLQEPQRRSHPGLEGHVEPRQSRRELDSGKIVDGIPAVSHELENPAKTIVAGGHFQDGSRQEAVSGEPRNQGEIALPVSVVERNIEEDVAIGGRCSGQRLLLLLRSRSESAASTRRGPLRVGSRENFVDGALDLQTLPGRKPILVGRLLKRGEWRADRRLRHI
jgi:hypothetical protein